MEDYEINILRRNGNWKKINPDDLLVETLKDKNTTSILPDDNNSNDRTDLLNKVNQINSIVANLEKLENEKNKLKEKLSFYEQELQLRKKNADEEIKVISKEVEMLNKTLGIIKSLKSF